MANIHDLLIIELAEVIKGYGNDPDVEDPFRLSEFYRFYELPNIAVSRENFEKMRPAQPEQRWIPCSERLPSENGDYLVTLENGVVKILGYSTTQRTTYPKGFYYIKDGFSWRQMQNPVVAWMPLPEPYKGGEQDG